MYTQRSSRGGALTLLVSVVLLCLVWNDVRDYLYGEHGYSFEVDQKVGTEMQVNLDITVAMKCHCEFYEKDIGPRWWTPRRMKCLFRLRIREVMK